MLAAAPWRRNDGSILVVGAGVAVCHEKVWLSDTESVTMVVWHGGQTIAAADRALLCPEARGMSRSKLVELSGVSKQQLSRLENGQIRLRLDHLKPFAAHLGYTPEQILLWDDFQALRRSDWIK